MHVFPSFIRLLQSSFERMNLPTHLAVRGTHSVANVFSNSTRLYAVSRSHTTSQIYLQNQIKISVLHNVK